MVRRLLAPDAVYATATAVLLCASAPAFAAFGGKPPLGPTDRLRHEFRPYDLAKLNYLGLNYCENLLDKRANITSYTHLGYDCNNQDAWHLEFPDDLARILECVAWEDKYSPVVRLEFARRLVKGILAAHVPGTKDYYSFRHRFGGKTFLIFDDAKEGKQGRVTLSNWGDAIEGCVKVGFRLRKDGAFREMGSFDHKDTPEQAGQPAAARAERYWNESPFVFKRHFTSQDSEVDFTGKYWLSDENQPLEYAFSTASGEALQIVVGEPGKPMPLMGDAAAPGFIHLPDRKSVFASPVTGDQIFNEPGFNYFLLRKATAWACPGYSAGLLVMWDGGPNKIEALATNGYGEIRLSFPARDGQALGLIWLYPFPWVNDKDMSHIFRSAEHFLSNGCLLQNGYPSQQLVNAIPAGLAAGAWLLAKYNDPLAITARIRAEGAVDSLLEPQSEGKTFIRSFFSVRAAAWMIQLGKLNGDARIVEKYMAHMDALLAQMTSAKLGYDGSAWAGGWDHFNCLKSAWLAYEATGNPACRDIYERALTVYTIDEQGICRYGQRMQAPGGFDTYAGVLALSAWGHAGKLDYVDKLIHLNVPNGWHHPEIPVKDLWNDAGGGPWAQDDSNGDYLGFSLRGLNLSSGKKWVLPVGAFPIYDAQGQVTVTREPVLENPYFRTGADPLVVLPREAARLRKRISEIKVTPDDAREKKHLVLSSGELRKDARICTGGQELLYRFDARSASGAAFDFRIKGDGYRIAVSPDGKRWVRPYDTWSESGEDKSMDVSFLTGSPDELINLATITPPDDAPFIVHDPRSRIEREKCRYLGSSHSLVYRLALPGAAECHLDLLAGNGYKLECSADQKTWTEVLSSRKIDSKKNADAGWLWSADATRFVARDGTLFARFSDTGEAGVYGGRTAFLRRLTVYGVLKSKRLWVRLSNLDANGQFELQRVTFRTWK